MFGNATDFEFDYNGETGVIVGYVSAFPRHPDAGTPVAPFPGLETATGDEAALFALVFVDWATPVTTIDLATGAASETTHDRTGMFGMPTGLSWNLRLVARHEGGYVLSQGSYAAGFHTATIPADVRAQVAGAPATVKIHDFPVR